MKYFVGAYAASPCATQWDPVLESRYWQGLKDLPFADLIRGLEHPFYGDLHRFDNRWFLDHVQPNWDFLLTCIPGTMDRLKVNPAFGLASTDEEGRRQALAFARSARDAVHRLNEHLKRSAVVSVAVHSAPSRGRSGVSSDRSRLAESLSEIRGWDWAGASVCLEHCDAFIPGQIPAKGFLSLEDELWALQESGKCGMLINWGRSAIESRDPSGPVRHLELARAAGCLAGLMFSGACVEDALYGAWADSHAPFHRPGEAWSRNSLMNQKAVAEAVDAALDAVPGAAGDFTDLPMGIKIQMLPEALSISDRLQRIDASLEFLNQRVRESLSKS